MKDNSKRPSASQTSPDAEAARRQKDEERVLVVPTSLFRAIGSFQGFSAAAVAEANALFASDQLRFIRRGDAERDPQFKQLIPYALFTWTDETGEVWVFAYLRGKGQGEKRLVSKWSVGVGGHINDSDASTSDGDLFEAGTRREIDEEVVLDANVVAYRKVGLVNDDETEVGRVHLGVVCRVELDAPKLRSNEPDLLEARFRPVSELLREVKEDPSRFESWTTLALLGLFDAPAGASAEN